MVKNYTGNSGKTGWGTKKTVRDAWVDAAKDGYKLKDSADTNVLMGCVVKPTNTTGGGLMGRGGESICNSKANNPNYIEDCGTVDEDGCVYDQEYYMTETDYQFSMTVDTLFQEVMADLELEAQAKYNAKLTAEQHMCIDANAGGIMGNRDMSSTYMWVKLRSKRVPKNYSTAGLKVTDFTASNDLYGSFCRARVTIQSDDPDIQAVLQSKTQNWSTAYFAVGDVFTCGSWIPQKNLEEIAKKVACKKAVAKGTLPSDTKCTNDADIDKIGLTTAQKWAVAAASIGGAGLGGAGGAYLADAVQSSNLLGGLIQGNRNSDEQNSRNVLAADNCQNAAKKYNRKLKSWSTASGTAKNAAEVEVRQAANDVTANASAIVYRNKLRREKSNDDGTTSVTYKSPVIQKFDTALGEAEECEDKPTGPDCASAIDALGALCKTVGDFGGQLADYDNNSRRQAINLTGALMGGAGLGLTAGFATANNIKAANRQQFTADQQEFMDNVGSSLYCFIGADEAGTYGDLIEITAE